MKYIVIGLGHFGASLARNLTAMGHEVIGIDNKMEKVEELKDKVTYVMCLNTTNPQALKTLPLHDVDAVIVAIGEDFGSTVLTLSLLKKLNVRRLIGRSFSILHRDVLDALEIKEIIDVEEEAAHRFAALLPFNQAVNLIPLTEEHYIIELKLPKKYVGFTLKEIDLHLHYALTLIAVKIYKPSGKIHRVSQLSDYQIIEIEESKRLLEPTDILVISGKMENLNRFINLEY